MFQVRDLFSFGVFETFFVALNIWRVRDTHTAAHVNGTVRYNVRVATDADARRRTAVKPCPSLIS